MKKLVICLLLSSCVAIPEPKTVEIEKKLSPFPPLTVEEYTRKPILEAQDNNFLVTDEFVKSSLKYKAFTDRVQDWKKLNNIK